MLTVNKPVKRICHWRSVVQSFLTSQHDYFLPTFKRRTTWHAICRLFSVVVVSICRLRSASVDAISSVSRHHACAAVQRKWTNRPPPRHRTDILPGPGVSSLRVMRPPLSRQMDLFPPWLPVHLDRIWQTASDARHSDCRLILVIPRVADTSYVMTIFRVDWLMRQHGAKHLSEIISLSWTFLGQHVQWQTEETSNSYYTVVITCVNVVCCHISCNVYVLTAVKSIII